MNRRNLEHLSVPEIPHPNDGLELPHLGFGAGFPPYLRGNHTTTYFQKPLKIISSKNESNPNNSKIQIDVLQELMYLAELKHHEQATEQIIKNLNQYQTILFSGFQLQKAGANPTQELAYVLNLGLTYLKLGIEKGLSTNDILEKLSFEFSVGTAYFAEIAKLRAARMLWAKQIKPFEFKNEKSLQLRIHSQTTDLNEPNHTSNITQNTISSLASILGGTESLKYVPSNDDSNNLNHTTILKNIPEILQNELQLTYTIDPWAGNPYVEQLTYDIFEQADYIISEIQIKNNIVTTSKEILTLLNTELK